MSWRPMLWKSAPSTSRRQFVAAAAGLALAGPGRAAAQEASPAAGGPAGAWTFTDDTGQTVTLPARPDRVAAYLPLAAALWDFGVRPVAVYGTTTQADGSPTFFVGNIALDEVASLGEVFGEFDIERLVALDVELVATNLWSAEPSVWGLPDTAIDQITARAPITFIRFGGQPLNTIVGRVSDLAAALGADLGAPAVAAAREAFQRAEADLAAAIAAKPGLTALFVSPTADALAIGNPAQIPDLAYLRDLGLAVVAPETTELFASVSWEEAGRYPADLIFRDARPASLSLEALADIATWQALPAVRAGQVAPWQGGFIPSYPALTPMLVELTAAIQAAELGIGG